MHTRCVHTLAKVCFVLKQTRVCSHSLALKCSSLSLALSLHTPTPAHALALPSPRVVFSEEEPRTDQKFPQAGMSDEERLDDILSYDPRRKRWEEGACPWGGAGHVCDRLPGGARFAVGAAVTRNTLLVAGGYNGRPLQLVEALDLERGVWVQAPDLTHARTDFAMAAAEAGVAVVGGGGTHTCELWDAHAAQWTDLASLPATRSSCRGGVIAGKFFVLGGFDDKERILNSVLQLDLAANVCMPAPSMLSARLACAAAVHQGRLVVAGGYNHEDGHLRCVETLDPREGKWQRAARMSVRRYDLGLAALDDGLYAAGAYPQKSAV